MKYKVGDKVRVKSLDWYNSNKNEAGYVSLRELSFTKDMSKFCGHIVTIKEIKNHHYIIKEDDFEWYFGDEMFEDGIYLSEWCCDKNDIQTINITPLKQQKIIWTESAPDITELAIGENFELVTDGGIYKVIKKKPKYPKTYIECAKILDRFSTTYIDGYKNALLEKLQELIICRDAYWKIAGEELGLGKPWEPDFVQDSVDKYSMLFANCIRITNSRILTFPTEEMRDTFYENFKDLIEQCKELL